MNKLAIAVVAVFIMIMNIGVESNPEKFSLQAIELKNVKYWAYQIQGIENDGAVERLAKSRYDMLVIEPTRTDWSSDNKYFNTREMVEKLKSTLAHDRRHRKLVIAYLSIGEAEKWRWYWKWNDTLPDFIVASDPDGWEDCYTVAYWDEDWKDIIIYGVNYSEEGRNYNSSLEEILIDGFDGVYLDWVEAFEDENVMERARKDGVNAAEEMIKFLQEIKDYARARNPDFIIIQQNGIELCGYGDTFSIIDGIAQEAIWYDGFATDNWNSKYGCDIAVDGDLTKHYLKYLNKYKINDKPVFDCEYALYHASNAYQNSYENGFIPYCSRRSLSKLTTTPPPNYFGVPFQKGFSYASWWNNSYLTNDSDVSLANLRETGTEYVSLITTWYQNDEHSTQIMPDRDVTPSDESIIHAIKRIHSLGMKVMLKPHVDLYNEKWRGEISFDSDGQWQEWFNSYKEFICHYAKIAEENNVEIFCIGCELVKTTHRKEWIYVIDEVRENFSGIITYAANWDNYENVSFWNFLDFIGIDAYFPLTNKNEPTLEELIQAWKRWKPSMEALHNITEKPIIFTEIGYRSIDGCNREPWNWQRHGKIDLQEQADCYTASFKTFWNETWFYGFYWWMWETDPNKGGTNDDGYTPYKKPAEGILKEYYLGINLTVEITKPRKGELYIMDREIMPISSDKAIVMGKITIEANPYSNQRINDIEFYIDDELKYSDNEAPYEWQWNEFAMGDHEIKVIAYDGGASAEDSIKVWILNL